MLSPSTGRVSQDLPTPKCSTCNQYVLLQDLGDHTCALTSPVPKPALTSAAAAALLPKRLQPSSRPASPASRQASPGPSYLSAVNSLAKVTFHPRSNVGSRENNTRDTSLSTNTSFSMLTRIPQDPRTRAPSNASLNQPKPPPTRSHFLNDIPQSQPSGAPFAASGQGMTPIRNIPHDGPLGHNGPYPSFSRPGTPANTNTGTLTSSPKSGSLAPQKIVEFSGTVGPGPQQSFVPPPERGIDTQTGGEAGMAGIGRRGFAAIARAAMLASRPSGPQAPRMYNALNHLDLDAVSRPTETPPLSAGSGYSSHSPGPTSPPLQSEFPSQPAATNVTRTPSPPDRFASTPTQPVSPSTHQPLFEKSKHNIRGNNISNDNPSMDSSTSATASVARKNTSDSIFSAMLYRSVTSSTNSSKHVKDVRRPISPVESESEYGGLAYADSTDYEDTDGDLPRSRSKSPDKPSFPLRAGSDSSSRHYHHPSVSEYSENSNNPIGILMGSTRRRPGHSRNASSSSISSAGGGGSSTRNRSNSSAIAQALGLSQTPPSDYAKLGGPGVTGIGGRLGRKESSSSRRNAGLVSVEEIEKALGEVKMKTRTKQPSFGSSSQRSNLYRSDSDTTSLSRKDDSVIGSGPKAHRSNTIHSPPPNSPEGKAVKLPMRSLTSPKVERDKALDGTSVKERVRKAKVCLKCQKVVDNGRWVSVDGGGVLCEKCWKNMYLPKCRRCTLAIEKQAVSSSDGQLKGKYHKECFNCDTCHKPFPDKTFYVYDGRPLCAYHYHEANDSLCAAARCGQPIEGPCAVSHSGDRYHPEHMTCEHPGYPPCKQMLSEYWEIDGRMLCERHAHSASVRGSDEEEEWTKSARAKKRVTRFIDLTGGAGGGGGGGGAGLGDGGLR